MDITSIKNLRTSVTFITPYIMLILGNIGCICNFLTFTAKQLRQNSCGCLASFHQLIYYEHRPKCYPRAGIYSYFLSMYSIFWTSLIPQSSMFIFGLITYYNIHTSRQRLMNTIQQQQQGNRTDSHMIRITLIQVISSSILLNIRTVYYSYIVVTTNDRKDEYRIAIEKLLLQISSFIFYLNFGKSFFMNTLSSKLFRKVFKERLILFYRHIICLKVKVHPINTIQSNDRKMVIVRS
ncbi:unnamed protein product [Adineta steineri]|uniref:G-protein coupled receptors family 1 profile domain-containing protein n=2 Tax=Adineta steineri TaxID=433720 RepID=A0A818SBI1_9BILA|nr:unnamed protein product [Adineta steineri]